MIAVLSGCGGDGDDNGPEVSLGEQPSRAAAQDKKIAALKSRLREQRRREATRPGNDETDRSPAGGGLLDERAASSFDQLAADIGGRVGLVVGQVGGNDAQSFGELTSGHAWSTIKLAIAARVLSETRGPNGLSANQQSQMRQALTASDNAAAAGLFSFLEQRHGGLAGASDAVGAPLRAAGDTTTAISTQGRAGLSTYGQTEWSLADQQRFTAKLAAGCVPDAPSARYLLDLMGEVVGGQRWGLGSTSIPARFKGGWGPEEDGGYLVRQTGILEFDGGAHPVVVSIAARPADGQFATGQQMLGRLAAWAVEHVRRGAATEGAC